MKIYENVTKGLWRLKKCLPPRFKRRSVLYLHSWKSCIESARFHEVALMWLIRAERDDISSGGSDRNAPSKGAKIGSYRKISHT